MSTALLLVLFAPLAGFILSGVSGLLYRRLTPYISTLAVGISLGAAVWLMPALFGGTVLNLHLFDWLRAGELVVPFALRADSLTGVMLLVVTGISFLVHVYSIGYQAHDRNVRRFFAYLNLFVFMMLILVLANNYLMLFIGWEGVGLASYLLIGYEHERPSASQAGIKAFVVNRIGDAGFILGMLVLFFGMGSLNFESLAASVGHGGGQDALLTVAGLLLFVGAAGKSAQLPLYVWLPDAMEGPSPVSALIHAATMVTAGVYVVARSSFIYTNAAYAGEIVAVVGACTALFAATIALVNNDLKRILAYSTVSQLGFMFIAVGLGAYAAGIFHLFTHAFFKALLFLGAGSVMHALHGELNIHRMGGLFRKLPQTAITFIIAALALAGIPPLAGFWSKDAILHAAFTQGSGAGKLAFVLGAIAALMTAFYMFRAVFLVFFGAPRDKALHDKAHESPFVMTIPLWILAAGSVAAGFAGVGAHEGWFGKTLSSSLVLHHQEYVSVPWLLPLAIGIAVGGVLVAALFYLWRKLDDPAVGRALKPVYLLLYNKYWVDEFYHYVLVAPLVFVARVLFYRATDRGLIDGLVDGSGKLSLGLGRAVVAFQTGSLKTYVLWLVLGAGLVFFLYLLGGTG